MAFNVTKKLSGSKSCRRSGSFSGWRFGRTTTKTCRSTPLQPDGLVWCPSLPRIAEGFRKSCGHGEAGTRKMKNAPLLRLESWGALEQPSPEVCSRSAYVVRFAEGMAREC
jgi:hypothetical protein